MVFKRRDKLTPLQWLGQLLWPKKGWARAAQYLKHRLHRLPDTPEKIARGVFAGVFCVFTPFYGLHFVLAFILAKIMRGNVVAALLATFVGNPLTYVPIGVISLKMGHLILGTEFDHHQERSFVGKSYDALDDLQRNFFALFTDRDADWTGLGRFFHEVFLPYLVGGIVPGLIAGLVAYYVTLPMIAAYQLRRRRKLKAKLEDRRQKAKIKDAPLDKVTHKP
ncbi:DUF2062 domain-containing protein [Celeribacter litoreus]|uniref:DUF2062 domain-containing protein n=1 Tax=Celeribacter litoreus TaxID=2876714 RepID=UPI001CCAED3B|nr:DUF2062 domain-containing protein [Celeribacter litoreus]MCA0042362.1 DUF2062 domain-containing protein [Celeribacter litoreus]